MKARIACAILGLAASFGCSSASLQGDDAGQDRNSNVTIDTAPTDATSPPIMGRRSYVVATTFTTVTNAGSHPDDWPSLSAHTFTMVLDWDGRTAIVGSANSGNITAFEGTSNGGAIQQPVSFSFGSIGRTYVTYESMDLTITDGGKAISGAGRGHAT